MNAILMTLALLIALPPVLLTLVFTIEIVTAFRVRAQRAPPVLDPSRGPVAVLIPAHDEAQGLGRMIALIKQQLAPCDRILVVADNCTDETADVARRAGAEVVERHDDQRRGKGYALDFGLRRLSLAPPESVVIIDADCRVGPGAIAILAQTAVARGRPVQALNLMVAPAGFEAEFAVAAFAWRINNHLRPLGLKALGRPCQLMGTGMAFPWPVIAGADLATGHIVEDLKLGIDLAKAGRPPLFCPEACVVSEFPKSVVGAQDQRRRWEGGHLAMMKIAFGQIFVGLMRRDINLLALALDLSVPPLTILALWNVAALILTSVPLVLSGSAEPFFIAMLGALMFVLSVSLCWRMAVRFGAHRAELPNLWRFVISKFRLYRSLVARRKPETWVRADRGSRAS